jgi:hypothetical protein
MGVSDSTIVLDHALSDKELIEWEEAFISVECYLLSLQLRNRLLVADMVRNILLKASERKKIEVDTPPRILAMEETLRIVVDWTQDVLDISFKDNRLAARGRLALLLTDMPGKWQPVFLTPAPWPPLFVDKMRSSYLAAGPQFAELTMTPTPLELNVLGTGAAQWFGMIARRPLIRKLYNLIILGAIAALVWSMWKG